MKRFLPLLAALCSLALPVRAVFPDKPIKLVVDFAPARSTDIVARLIAEQMTASLNQTVVVENKPGASGNIATLQVMNAPADGYTLLVQCFTLCST